VEVFAKNSNVIPVLDENNCMCGYYEIDDIMTFSSDDLKRTRQYNQS
jgi:Mg/Co/Ni transporter MgtE